VKRAKDNATLSLFDAAKAAREARDDGIRRATEHADAVSPRWSDEAYEALLRWCEGKSGREFLAESARLDLVDAVPAPPDQRAWGGVFVRAARAGYLERAGYRKARDPKVHCSINTLWKII
jgi:hypothetical protein